MNFIRSLNPLIKIHKYSPLIIFILGVWFFCVRILGYNFEYIPGDLGDSRFINFLLEHAHQWITGHADGFWDAAFMYPFKNTIALSDSMLGTLPFYSVWRIAGISPETSYQLWWICICALNYWISYFIFKKWFVRSEIALVLAFIFAFSIFNIGQLNYMQMIVRFMVPVVFYAAYKMIATPSIKYLFTYCFGLVVQFYCVMYTGFHLLYFSLLFIFIYCFYSKKWKDLFFYFKKEKWLLTSFVLIASLLVALLLLVPYLVMSKTVGLRLYKEVIIYLPTWNSFLFPHESSLAWKYLFDTFKPHVPAWWLHYLFVGIIPFTALIISPLYLFYNWYKKIKTPLLLKTCIITSIIIVLLHLRTDAGLTLYALIFKLPGINSMRVLNRFMNVELFVLLLLVGYLVVRFKNNYLFIIVILIFADNWFSPESIPREKKADLIKRKEILLSELSKHDLKKYSAVALVDSTQPAYITHVDMMLAAQTAGIKTVNGYSSYCPDEFGEFFNHASDKGLSLWIQNQGIKRENILLLRRNY